MPKPTAHTSAVSMARGFLAVCTALALVGTPSALGQLVPLPLPEETQEPVKPLTPPLINNDGLTNPVSVTGEIRGLWVVRDSITTPAKVRNTIALAKKYGFNTLFVQVRGRGDAFYNSAFEPRAEELTSQSLDFDPLALCIEEAHNAGLEVHAWLNTFLVWSKARKPYATEHILHRHPEWLVQDKQGRVRTTPTEDCEGGFLDPAIPAVREYTKQVFLDVVQKYPVDGLHFDYVRFPSNAYSFSPTSLNAFKAHMAILLSENDRAYAEGKTKGNRLAYVYLYPKEWKEWRQELVADTVREISDAAHKIRPNLIVSAAVFPNYSVASEDKGQGWHDWLRDGYLNAVCPMTYNKNTSVVGQQVRDALLNSHGRPVIPGVGAWQMPASSAIAKAELCRQLGANGLNFFSYDGMTRNGRTEAYLAKVSQALFTTPTVSPNWGLPKQPTGDIILGGTTRELDLRPSR